MIRRNQHGFSLAELLVTIVVIGVVAGTLGVLASWFQDAAVAKNRADLLATAESALDTTGDDIMLSASADPSNRIGDDNAPGAPSNLLSWTSSSSVLVLAKAALDSDKNILFSDALKYITEKDNVIYFVDSGTLYRRTLASDNTDDAATTTCPPASASASCPSDRVITTGVTSFSLKYYDADEDEVDPEDARSVQLSITLQRKIGGHTISASYSTRMVFRNA